MKKRLNDVKETCKDYYEDIIKRHRQGHYRKSSSYDCGKSRCWLCHFNKLIGKRPIKEQYAGDEVNYEDGQRDI